MRPINGVCRMTQAEKNERRRMLDKDPFHHELTLRTARRYRKKNRDRINMQKREYYAANAEKERERQRKWRAENKNKVKESWRRWADKNRAYLRERDEARAKDPAEKERRKRDTEKRARRMKEDPEYAARIREQKRIHYHKNKNSERGRAWYRKFIWLPKWKAVVAEGPDRISAYLRRANDRTRREFMTWYASGNLLDRTKPQGRLSDLYAHNSHNNDS